MNDHILDDFYPSYEMTENQTVYKKSLSELLQNYRFSLDDNLLQNFEQMFQEYRRFLVQPPIILDSLSEMPTKQKVNWKKEGF